MSNAVLHRPNRIQVSFPDLASLLYDENLRTLSDVQQAYNEEVLREIILYPERKAYLDSYLNKLENYLKFYYNHRALMDIEQIIDDFKFYLFKFNIPFEIFGRIKSYTSFMKKLRSFIYDHLDPLTINDEFGYRLIVGTRPKDNQDSINLLYLVANLTINYFVDIKHYKLIVPSQKNSTGFNKLLYPDVFVPEQSQIEEKNRPFVKDYYVDPKANGYQSLHIVFLEPSGRTIEVQMRTFAGEYHSTYIADHQQHKKNRYSTGKVLTTDQLISKSLREAVINVDFDPSRVKLDNYYSANGKTLDRIGLSETMQNPFNNFFI